MNEKLSEILKKKARQRALEIICPNTLMPQTHYEINEVTGLAINMWAFSMNILEDKDIEPYLDRAEAQ